MRHHLNLVGAKHPRNDGHELDLGELLAWTHPRTARPWNECLFALWRLPDVFGLEGVFATPDLVGAGPFNPSLRLPVEVVLAPVFRQRTAAYHVGSYHCVGGDKDAPPVDGEFLAVWAHRGFVDAVDRVVEAECLVLQNHISKQLRSCVK